MTEIRGKSNKKPKVIILTISCITNSTWHTGAMESSHIVQKTVDCPFLPTVTFPLVPSGLYKSTPKHLSFAMVEIWLSLLLWHRKYKLKTWWSRAATDNNFYASTLCFKQLFWKKYLQTVGAKMEICFFNGEQLLLPFRWK